MERLITRCRRCALPERAEDAKEEEEEEEEGDRQWAKPRFFHSAGMTLHGYQRAAVRWLQRVWAENAAKGAVLGDGMGLGKTVQSIAFAAHVLQEREAEGLAANVLVVCPLSVLAHWVENCEKHLGRGRTGERVGVVEYHGPAMHREALRQAVLLGGGDGSGVGDDDGNNRPRDGQAEVGKAAREGVAREFFPREADDVKEDNDDADTAAAQPGSNRNQKRPSMVWVTTYEVALQDADYLSWVAWDLMVVDEAHRLKNDQAKLSMALQQMETRMRLLLTGTPVQNDLSEFYSLLSFAMPTLFKRHLRDAFLRFFQAPGSTRRNPLVRNVNMLRQVIRPFFLRRTSADVKLPLPPLTEITVRLPMAQMQIKYYRAILLRDLHTLDARDQQRLTNVVSQLRKACSHPYLFVGAEPEPYHEGDHIFETSNKLAFLEEVLPRLKADGKRVLLFSQSTDMLDIIQDYLTYRGHAYERLDGSVRADERFGAISRFQNAGSSSSSSSSPSSSSSSTSSAAGSASSSSGAPFIFLLSTRAGGVGLNLQSANVVIFFDSDWNPQADLQALARCWRFGQKSSVVAMRLVSHNSVEEIILRRSRKKLRLTRTIMGSGEFAGVVPGSGDDDDDEEDDDQGAAAEAVPWGTQKLSRRDDPNDADEDDDDDDALGTKPGAKSMVRAIEFGLSSIVDREASQTSFQDSITFLANVILDRVRSASTKPSSEASSSSSSSAAAPSGLEMESMGIEPRQHASSSSASASAEAAAAPRPMAVADVDGVKQDNEGGAGAVVATQAVAAAAEVEDVEEEDGAARQQEEKRMGVNVDDDNIYFYDGHDYKATHQKQQPKQQGGEGSGAADEDALRALRQQSEALQKHNPGRLATVDLARLAELDDDEVALVDSSSDEGSDDDGDGRGGKRLRRVRKKPKPLYNADDLAAVTRKPGRKLSQAEKEQRAKTRRDNRYRKNGYSSYVLDESVVDNLLQWVRCGGSSGTAGAASASSSSSDSPSSSSSSSATAAAAAIAGAAAHGRMRKRQNDNEADPTAQVALRYCRGDASRATAASQLENVLQLHTVDTSGRWTDRGYFKALTSAYPHADVPVRYAAAQEHEGLELGDVILIPAQEPREEHLPSAVQAKCALSDEDSEAVEWFRRPLLLSLRRSAALGDHRYVALMVVQTRRPRQRGGGGGEREIDKVALAHCLGVIAKIAKALPASLHTPRIGYGTAGHDWYSIERLLRRYVGAVGVRAVIYYFRRRNNDADDDDDDDDDDDGGDGGGGNGGGGGGGGGGSNDAVADDGSAESKDGEDSGRTARELLNYERRVWRRRWEQAALHAPTILQQAFPKWKDNLRFVAKQSEADITQALIGMRARTTELEEVLRARDAGEQTAEGDGEGDDASLLCTIHALTFFTDALTDLSRTLTRAREMRHYLLGKPGSTITRASTFGATLPTAAGYAVTSSSSSVTASKLNATATSAAAAAAAAARGCSSVADSGSSSSSFSSAPSVSMPAARQPAHTSRTKRPRSQAMADGNGDQEEEAVLIDDEDEQEKAPPKPMKKQQQRRQDHGTRKGIADESIGMARKRPRPASTTTSTTRSPAPAAATGGRARGAQKLPPNASAEEIARGLYIPAYLRK